MDPHERSHTAVVLDECEQIALQIRVVAWVGCWRSSWWSAARRSMCPPLACRARKLSGRSGRKTDEFDARSVAIAARHNRGLRRVAVDDATVVLALLLERR